MKIKSFTPATDWFFTFKDHQGKVTNYPLVGFAVVDGSDSQSDQVVGMVSVFGGGDNPIMSGTCSLTTVPPVPGTYKHKSEIKEDSEQLI